MSCGLPPMPQPSEWIYYDGFSASLLEYDTIDDHTLYSVFLLLKHQVKIIGLTFPIPVALRSDETTDEYEAESLVVLNRMQMQWSSIRNDSTSQ